MKKYDIAMIGHICRDRIQDTEGVRFAPGSAVYYSSIAAARSGASVYVLSKSEDSKELYAEMDACGVTTEVISGDVTTAMECIYQGANKETRKITHISSAPAFVPDDIKSLPDAEIYHIAGLICGEFSEELIPMLSARGRDIALDVQTMIRISTGGELSFKDWESKREYLPMIRYLKTDAAEAAVLTGCTDRVEAARILSGWTGGEVMVTYNEEVLLCSGDRIWKSPFTAENLSGRSGRGDSTFAAYLGERVFGRSPGEALEYAAALCSIKMEKEGPFSGNRDMVFHRIKRQAS